MAPSWIKDIMKEAATTSHAVQPPSGRLETGDSALTLADFNSQSAREIKVSHCHKAITRVTISHDFNLCDDWTLT